MFIVIMDNTCLATWQMQELRLLRFQPGWNLLLPKKTAFKDFWIIIGSWRCLLCLKQWSCCSRYNELSLTSFQSFTLLVVWWSSKAIITDNVCMCTASIMHGFVHVSLAIWWPAKIHFTMFACIWLYFCASSSMSLASWWAAKAWFLATKAQAQAQAQA